MGSDPNLSRTEAQRRADQVRQFQAELAQVQRDGALELTPQQRARLDAYHHDLLEELARRFDVDVSDRQKHLSRGMQVVAMVSAIALAASLFLFFYRYWNRMGTPLQVGVLALAPLVSLAAAEFASRHVPLRFLTGLLALLAFACFVFNIAQVGAIFALPPSPEGLLVETVFALGLAYAYGQPLLLLAGAAGAAVYVSASVLRLTGAWWMQSLLERPENLLLGGAAIVGWSFAPHRVRDDFPPLLRDAGLAIAGVTAIVLGQAGELSWWAVSRTVIEVTYQLVAFLIPAAAVWMGIRRGWTSTLAIGGALFTAALFVKYVDWWWDWMPRYLFFLVVGATALAVLVLFSRARAGRRAQASAERRSA
jgi:hypothetical protein